MCISDWISENEVSDAAERKEMIDEWKAEERKRRAEEMG